MDIRVEALKYAAEILGTHAAMGYGHITDEGHDPGPDDDALVEAYPAIEELRQIAADKERLELLDKHVSKRR